MSLLQKLKQRAAENQNNDVFSDKEIAKPMLDKISGGGPKIWCKARWAKGCDSVD
jgi:hypothetical protein